MEFKNLGPTAITTSDTVLFQFSGLASAYRLNARAIAVNDTAKITFPGISYTGGVNGTRSFCVVAYVFRNGVRTDVGADTANNRACVDLNVRGGVGIGSDTKLEVGAKVKLNIFPNPANTSISLGYKVATNGNATARVLDITGREVMNQDFGMQTVGASDLNMNIADLAPGMYMVELVQDNVRAVGRFIRM